MWRNKKVIVVMPAYNAEATLRQTYEEVMAQKEVDHIILVDDCSSDRTSEIASSLANVRVYRHVKNLGYGGNQKSCYRLALEEGADFVVMVHPDYQYTPKLIPAMTSMLGSGLYSAVLGSRILGGKALAGGMPLIKYIANRGLTAIQNIALGAKLSEYHTGYRAFTSELLRQLPLESYSDDFIFDNQILTDILWQGHLIGELSCPTSYFAEASSINLQRSAEYAIGCLYHSVLFLGNRLRRNQQQKSLFGK